MAESDRHQELADRLLEGVAALRADRAADAVAPLLAVASDPELAAAGALADIRARACSLLAQALLRTDRPDDASPWIDEALRILRSLEDREGLARVGELRREVLEARQQAATRAQGEARSRRLAATPLDDILATVTAPPALLDVLIRKANADADDGRPGDALPIAERALGLADELRDVRGQVLARMSIARAVPDRAAQLLVEAWSVAERAGEPTLVGAVARAAELAGVPLPVQVGPTLGRSP